ncbi:MAG: tubulin-like doman-containing protein [Aphanocapsa lilacina HA4352-LM1]|nr:tubulin-like doman-containing protein [Aphanocapsa lilacina HA4352-LM1]
MSYYIIGIGGTGAKCVEALVHLTAAVALDQPIHVLLVDPDKANGSVGQTQQTIGKYVEASRCLRGSAAGSPFMQTQWVPAEPLVWSPFANTQQPVLRDLFQYEFLSQQHPVAAGLMEVLYSEQEMNASLDKGFLGRPSIGAAVFANSVDLLGSSPWQRFFGDLICNDNDARIFLVGSVFGGTGAAGLPTLARLLADRLQKDGRREQFRLGGALLLPYFSFPPGKDPAQLQAKAGEFLLRSQAALGYYQDQLKEDDRSFFDSVYLLGHDSQPSVGFHSLGSTEQRNPPHFLEIYAAAAALHFFKDAAPRQTRTYMTARLNTKVLGWDSLPEGAALREPLANLYRFVYAYSSKFFYGQLQNQFLNERGGPLKWTTWYKAFFPKGQSQQSEEDSQRIFSYRERLVAWLQTIQQPQEGMKVHLLNTDHFKVLDTDGPNRTPDDVSKVLDRYKPQPGSTESGLRQFVHALYHECRQRP